MKIVLLLHFRDDSMDGHIRSQVQIIAPSLTFQEIVYRVSDAQKTRLREAAACAPATPLQALVLIVLDVKLWCFIPRTNVILFILSSSQ